MMKNNKNWFKMMPILLLSVSTLGCASLGIHNVSEGPYPGVTVDIASIMKPEVAREYGVPLPISIIDLPFSFIMDTIFLPYDLFQVARKSSATHLAEEFMKTQKDTEKYNIHACSLNRGKKNIYTFTFCPLDGSINYVWIEVNLDTKVCRRIQ